MESLSFTRPSVAVHKSLGEAVDQYPVILNKKEKLSGFGQGLQCDTKLKSTTVFIEVQLAGSADSLKVETASSMLTGPLWARLEHRIPREQGQGRKVGWVTLLDSTHMVKATPSGPPGTQEQDCDGA